MMMRCSLVLFALLGSYLLKAQDTITIVKQPVNKYANFRQLLFYNDATKSYILSVKDKKSVHRILLDSNYKLVQQFSEEREWIESIPDEKRFLQILSTKPNILFSNPFSLLACMASQNGYIDVFEQNNRSALLFQEISFAAKKSSYLKSWTAEKKESIILQFAFNNNFYWITYNDKLETYKLYKANPSLAITSVNLDFIKQPDQRDPLNIHIAEVIESPFSSVGSTEKNRLFISNDSIFILTHASKNEGPILHGIDGNTLAHAYSKKFKPNSNNEKVIKSASTFFSDHIVQSTLTDSNFYIGVTNVHSGQIVTDYRMSKEMMIRQATIEHPLFESNGTKKPEDISTRKNIWDEEWGEKLFVHAFSTNDTLSITTGITSVSKDYITDILFLGLNTYLAFALPVTVYTSNPYNPSYILKYNTFMPSIPNILSQGSSVHRIFHKFSFQSNSLVPVKEIMETRPSKPEERFYKKHGSDIIHIFAAENKRIYLYYSDKMDSYLLVGFNTN